jgi:hypothetical protein
MSDKFNPAPLDKDAADRKEAAKADKATHNELQKGLKESFPASDPLSATNRRRPSMIAMRSERPVWPKAAASPPANRPTTLTRLVPIMSSSRATARLRSMIRPRSCGKRSLMRTSKTTQGRARRYSHELRDIKDARKPVWAVRAISTLSGEAPIVTNSSPQDIPTIEKSHVRVRK